MTGGYVESRQCPRCDRDFLYPAYGKRVCNDCRMDYGAKFMREYRRQQLRAI